MENFVIFVWIGMFKYVNINVLCICNVRRCIYMGYSLLLDISYLVVLKMGKYRVFWYIVKKIC